MLGKVVRLGGVAPRRMVLVHKTGKTDAWRTHPLLSYPLSIKRVFPGLGTALALFAGFVAFDKLLGAGSKPKKGH